MQHSHCFLASLSLRSYKWGSDPFHPGRLEAIRPSSYKNRRKANEEPLQTRNPQPPPSSSIVRSPAMTDTPSTLISRTQSKRSSRDRLPPDVLHAEQEFFNLERTLNAQAQDITRKSSLTDSTLEGTKDLEKAEENTERFDLKEYLTSSNDANQAAGIKHKVSCSHTLIFVISLIYCAFSSTLASLGRIFRSMSLAAPTIRFMSEPLVPL